MTTIDAGLAGLTVPDDDNPPVPVDQATEPKRTAFDRITAHREATKTPIVVGWLKVADERTAILRWAVSYAWHILRFHVVRAPIYQLRFMLWAPRGIGRTVRVIVDGLLDAEARPLRKSAVLRDDVKEWTVLAKERNARVRHRSVAAAVLSIPVLAFGLAMLVGALRDPATDPLTGEVVDVRVVGLWFVDGWLWWACAEALVLLFGAVGRPQGERLISRATTPLHVAPVLRADVVEVALRAISGLMKKDAVIEFPDPIVKDGPGWLARINLPHGVTPADVMSKRPALASGLRRPLGCVWPAPGPHHGGQLDLWVGDQDLATAKQPAYPLLERGTADLFRPLPYGTNQRNGKVGVTLMENNALIGAMVGQGKTSAMRVLALGTALDITAEHHIWELKGSGDLGGLEQIAHAYGSGQDDETICACVDDLRMIRADIERRAATIKRIAKATPELCPNNKVTRELANRRDLGLHPVVVYLDEVQNLYSHETYGKEAAKLVLDIIRLGRAFGVILVQATQRPDADSLPKAISSNAGIRIALRVMDDYANNAILGSGMYAAGVRATDFTSKDKGIAWMVGISDEPVVAKSFNITAGMAEKVGARARKLREESDRLTGMAAGLVVDEQERRAAGHDLLADLRRVMADQGVGWAWTAQAAGWLEVVDPIAYGGLTAQVLGQMLGARGVTTRQINRVDPTDGVRRNLQGFELEQIVTAQAGPRPSAAA